MGHHSFPFQMDIRVLGGVLGSLGVAAHMLVHIFPCMHSTVPLKTHGGAGLLSWCMYNFSLLEIVF